MIQKCFRRWMELNIKYYFTSRKKKTGLSAVEI